MGFHLAIDEQHRILLIQFEESITDEVFLSAYESARTWIATHGSCSQLTDFSRIKSFGVTANGIRTLAMQPPLAPDAFLRVVVAPQEVAFGMTRMFETLGSRSRDRVHIVRILDEAYRLLGIDTPSFRAIENE